MFQVTPYPVFGYAVLAEWLWMLGWRGVMLLWAYFGLVSSVVWFFQGCGGAYGLCPKSRAHRVRVLSRLPRFILLGSFSDTLLVVSILDICSHFWSPEGVKVNSKYTRTKPIDAVAVSFGVN